MNRVEGIEMRIGLLHNENAFSVDLLRKLRTALAQHEIIEWIAGKDAPDLDFDVLLAMADVGRELLMNQPKLALL